MIFARDVTHDLLLFLGVAIAAVLLIIVVRARHRSHAVWTRQTALEQVCPHLRPALEALLARGHLVLRIGQLAPDLPLEIHLHPAFDPKSLYRELNLAEPVMLSERNALYCKDDWCELHPLD